MQVHVNLLGVIVAAISSMLIGTIYYSDSVVGKQWRALSKIDQKEFNKKMPKVMPYIFIAALLTAYIVGYFTYLFHNYFLGSWVGAGIQTSLILWLGVSATSIFIHSSLDQKPSKLIVIATGNRLLSILAMGLILGLIHP